MGNKSSKIEKSESFKTFVEELVKDANDLLIECLNKHRPIADKEGDKERAIDYDVIPAPVHIKNVDGAVFIEFGADLDHEAAIRDSFMPGDKPADLIYLFNNGWNYEGKRAPFGEWRGQYTIAKSSRTGQNFIQDAVDEFNETNNLGAKLDLPPEYK